jgi:hypothetical protein
LSSAGFRSLVVRTRTITIDGAEVEKWRRVPGLPDQEKSVAFFHKLAE